MYKRKNPSNEKPNLATNSRENIRNKLIKEHIDRWECNLILPERARNSGEWNRGTGERGHLFMGSKREENGSENLRWEEREREREGGGGEYEECDTVRVCN